MFFALYLLGYAFFGTVMGVYLNKRLDDFDGEMVIFGALLWPLAVAVLIAHAVGTFIYWLLHG